MRVWGFTQVKIDGSPSNNKGATRRIERILGLVRERFIPSFNH